MAGHRVAHWLMACFGTLVLGLGAPILLTCFYTSFDMEGFSNYSHARPMVTLERAAQQFLQLCFAAGMFCGPGALILCLIVYTFLRGDPAAQNPEPAQIFARGRWAGAVLAFANFPGYLSGFILGWERPYTELRVALLFVVAGMVSGSWIAWQAWRSHHPEAGFLPRYSLTTLLAGTLGLGAVLAVFAPGK